MRRLRRSLPNIDPVSPNPKFASFCGPPHAEIIAFCRSHMSGFKTPKAVVFGVIPKTSTGKIQKFLLRNQVDSAKAISA